MSGKQFAALFVAVSLLAGVALAAADNGWIAVNKTSNAKADVRLLAQSKGALTIAASLPGLEKELLPAGRTGAKGETFAQLTIPGFAHTGDLGKPKLPMLTAVLDVPIGATVSATVVDGDYREYKLSDLGIDARIVPALPSVPKVAGAQPQFTYDAAAYAADAMYPGRLSDIADNSKEGGLARGHRLVTVQLYPVQYNPAGGTLRVYSELKADVRISGGDYAKSMRLVRKDYSRDWESFIQRMTLNYDPSRYGAKDSLLNLPIYYDIFYGPSFVSAAQRLADWKTQKGYKVRINNAGGWTAAQINDSIRLRAPKATYVAVIGDPNATGSDALPPSIAAGPGMGDQTDLYYAECDDNSTYLPDLFNARLSVQTAADADVVVDKLINYEKAEFGAAGTAWLRKATLIAGYDASYQPVGIATNEYCRQILAREGYTTIDTLILGSSEQEGRITAAINDGRAWTIYTAHGSQTYWALSSGSFTIPELQATTNQDMYTMPAGHCCLANDFQYGSDCFGESWPKQPNKGGISYYGSVPSTYWDEDDWLQRRYFDAIYDSVPGTPGYKMSEMGRATTWSMYWMQNNTGTSRKQYYFEAYHVMNDASMDFWTDVPHTLTVTHAPSVAPMSGSFAVNVKEGSTNIQGALVCGWVRNRAGEHWSAYTDANGDVTLPAAPSTAGDTMLVTVTKHNFDPYEGQALVIVPAVVTIDPDTIPVLTSTPVTVTVLEPGTFNPVPNVAVTIGGLGVTPALADTTDASGIATFNVYPLYGEVLTVRGREVGQSYDMFTGSIWVTGAASFTSADVAVSVPDLGLNGVLTPDYEALFDASCDPSDFALLVSGCGLDFTANTAGGSLQAPGTPTAVGTVTAHIVKGGYNVYTETFPCRIVYGTLAGQVTEVGPGTPVAGVALGGWVSGADTTATPAAFHLTTDGSGNYSVPDSLVVGRYDIYASKFGYIGQMETPMVVYGPNTYNFAITAAPSGDVSGAVTEVGTGIPLAATVNVYRTDDNSLYATTATDSGAGGTYSVTGLPYFNYRFEVRAYHHRKGVRTVTVDGPTRTEDFALETTQGDILVIDDNDAKGEESKVTGKRGDGTPIVVRNTASGGPGKAGESAAQIAAMLAELGYSVTGETSAVTDPGTWSGYDAVVWSCGPDETTLSVAAYLTNLINYVSGGGKLLIEGGEVGYDHYGNTAFANGVLHANDWNSDNAGALNLAQASHALATMPNALPASLSIAYASYGDEDAITPTNGGVAVYGTTNYPADGGLIAYDAGGDPNNGDVVYYAFNFLKLADSTTRAQVLENSIEYLLRPNAGATGSVSGTVTLSGQATHEGVTVAIAGYPAATTDASGAYQISDMFDGTYEVTASKEDYTSARDTVTVSGGAVTGVNFTLYPLVVLYENDLEAGNGGLTATGDWQYGEVIMGPGSAHSGTHVWAAALSDSYSNSSNSTLTMAALKGGKVLPAGVVMEYWQWYNFEGSGSYLYDGGNVKVSTDGGSSWTVVTPEGGYTGTAYSTNAGVAGEPIFGGQATTWTKQTFDLAAYAGQPVTIRFHFGSDGSVVRPGWYLDDIKISYADYTGVAGGTTTPALPAAYALNTAAPNPFSGRTTIRFALPKAASVNLAVYNVAGQRVKMLAAGAMPAGVHSVSWDGTGENGRRVAGGVYLYRLTAPDHQSTKRMVYVR